MEKGPITGRKCTLHDNGIVNFWDADDPDNCLYIRFSYVAISRIKKLGACAHGHTQTYSITIQTTLNTEKNAYKLQITQHQLPLLIQAAMAKEPASAFYARLKKDKALAQLKKDKTPEPLKEAKDTNLKEEVRKDINALLTANIP